MCFYFILNYIIALNVCKKCLLNNIFIELKELFCHSNWIIQNESFNSILFTRIYYLSFKYKSPSFIKILNFEIKFITLLHHHSPIKLSLLTHFIFIYTIFYISIHKYTHTHSLTNCNFPKRIAIHTLFCCCQAIPHSAIPIPEKGRVCIAPRLERSFTSTLCSVVCSGFFISHSFHDIQ